MSCGRYARGLVHLTILLGFTALILVSLPAGTMAAPPADRTDGVEVSARADQNRVDVTVTYTVTPGRETDQIPLEATLFNFGPPQDLSATDAEGRIQQRMEVTADGKLARIVVLPGKVLPAGKAYTFTLSYAVPRTRPDELGIPLPYVKWKPPATANVFRATVTLPPGYHFVDSFPRERAVNRQGDPQTVTFAAEVIPALIRVDISPSRPGFFTYEHKLELLVLFLIVAGTGVWWYTTPLRKR